jgi:hypothetical protein
MEAGRERAGEMAALLRGVGRCGWRRVDAATQDLSKQGRRATAPALFHLGRPPFSSFSSLLLPSQPSSQQQQQNARTRHAFARPDPSRSLPSTATALGVREQPLHGKRVPRPAPGISPPPSRPTPSQARCSTLLSHTGCPLPLRVAVALLLLASPLALAQQLQLAQPGASLLRTSPHLPFVFARPVRPACRSASASRTRRRRSRRSATSSLASSRPRRLFVPLPPLPSKRRAGLTTASPLPSFPPLFAPASCLRVEGLLCRVDRAPRGHRRVDRPGQAQWSDGP